MSKEHKKRPPVFQSAEEQPPLVQEVEDVIESVQAEEPVQETNLEDPPEPVAPEREEKPSEDDLPDGWSLISEAQHTGKVYLVTHDLACEGASALWRKTRILSRNRWVTRGKWSDALTRRDILPEPRFFKELP